LLKQHATLSGKAESEDGWFLLGKRFAKTACLSYAATNYIAATALEVVETRVITYTLRLPLRLRSGCSLRRCRPADWSERRRGERHLHLQR